MRISEIFYSIDGEGKRCGEPAIFIRTVGCNLTCPWCDTKYAWGNGDATAKDMSIDEIMSEVAKYRTKNITLTGGEPLIADNVGELIHVLSKNGYNVNVETNGAVSIAPYIHEKNVFFTLDYKALSSKQNDKMLISNYKLLGKNDCVKCVVATKQDMQDFVKMIIEQKNKILHYIPLYISPVFGEIEPKDIVNFVMHEAPRDYKFTTHLQIHKLIWNPNERGV